MADDYQMDIYSHREAMVDLRPAWERLWQTLPGRSPFSRWEWAWYWYEAYRGLAHPLIVVARRGRQVAGIAPLARTRRRKLVIAGGLDAWPQYVTFLFEPGRGAEVVRAVLECLERRSRACWQCMELPMVASEGEMAAALRGLGAERVAEWRVAEGWLIELPESWEAYLAGLTKNRRRTIRKLLRKNRDVEVRAVSEGQPFEVAWRVLVRLHQQRWEAVGEPGCFRSRGFYRFHRALARQWTAEGRADIVTAWLGDRPIAADYVFLDDATMYGYQAGYDLAFRHRGPGLFLMVTLLRRALLQGLQCLDMLGGDYDYKRRFATRTVELSDFWVSGPTLGYRLFHRARATLRTAGRSVRARFRPGRQSATAEQR